MAKDKFSIVKQIKSFKYAFNGFSILFKEEHNSRLHLFFMLLAICFGFYFHLSLNEWGLLIFAIALVFVSEIFNSAIENICDFISPDRHEKIKKIKDLSAAAVLFSTFCSIAIGLILFLPKIIAFI